MVDNNGLMREAEMANEAQMGNIEYSLQFKSLLDESPLFKLGFDPERIFYQTQSQSYTNKPATYIPERAMKTLENQGISKVAYDEIMSRIEKNQIPKGDFVFMRSFMMPGDRTKDYPAFKENIQGLDEAHEMSTHMHEFMHRAINNTPELQKWMKDSGAEPYEELIMGAFTSKYFPQMAEYEKNRIANVYNVDITSEKNKKQLDTWVNQIEKIAIDILKEQGRYYGQTGVMEKIKPKQKPPIPKTSFIDMLKNLF
jgi:hypothetical protein